MTKPRDLADSVNPGGIPASRVTSASTSAAGVVQLNDAINSTSTTTAATPNAVKQACDLANAALPKSGGTMTGAITFASSQNLGATPETVYSLPDAGVIALDPDNGSIQSSVLSGNATFSESLADGQTIVLILENGASYVVQWPSTTWVSATGNTAPGLTTKDVIVFWKVGTIFYGAYVGSYV